MLQLTAPDIRSSFINASLRERKALTLPRDFAGFECSANVRKLPPVAYIGFDVQAARRRRIEALGVHVRNFARNVRDGN